MINADGIVRSYGRILIWVERMGNIKTKLIKNEKIRYLTRFFKNYAKADIVRDSNRLYSNPESIFVEHKGSANIGRLVFPIFVDSDGWGFCAAMRYVLAGLWYADEYGLSPVVEYSMKSLYAEEPGFMGTDNPFEYYFEPVTVPEWKKSRALVRTKGVTDGWPDDRTSTVFQCLEEQYGIKYGVPDEYAKMMGDVWKRHIKLNEHTEISVTGTDIYREKKTLGIHVRGTDYNSGPDGHPVKIPETEHAKMAEMLLSQGGYQQIFVATDEKQVIDFFSKKFGEQVIFYDDIMRSEDGSPVHFSDSARKDHHYTLGLEILKDMYALAACDGFVGGVSQVSNCVRILKYSMEEKYSDIEIIDHGINGR